jgi:hypothetical protein
MLKLTVADVSGRSFGMREVGVSEIVEVVEDVVDDTEKSVGW